MNLIAAFDGAVRKHSDKTFLRSGDVSISYGEMKARSHLAAAVLAEADVGPGAKRPTDGSDRFDFLEISAAIRAILKNDENVAPRNYGRNSIVQARDDPVTASC
jgi:hypothetical protein